MSQYLPKRVPRSHPSQRHRLMQQLPEMLKTLWRQRLKAYVWSQNCRWNRRDISRSQASRLKRQSITWISAMKLLKMMWVSGRRPTNSLTLQWLRNNIDFKLQTFNLITQYDESTYSERHSLHALIFLSNQYLIAVLFICSWKECQPDFLFSFPRFNFK